MASMVYNGASSTLRIDGAEVVTGDPGANAMGGITVGTWFDQTSPWDGLIAEIAIFDRLLDAAEIGQMETYLATRYGVTLP